MTNNLGLFVFLPIESYRRELDYKINLARYFCAQGFSVIIGDSVRLRDYLMLTRHKGAFIEKGGIPDPNYYIKLRNKGIVTYDLCEEGAFSGSYWIEEQSVRNTIKVMARIFLWGNFQYNDLASKCNEQEVLEKFFISGHPSFEISQPKYRKVFQAFNHLTEDEPYILINTNFACSSKTLEEEAIITKRPKKHEQLLEEYFKYSLNQFEKFKLNIHEIIKAFPLEKFVIRPHPVEKESVYIKEFGDYKNVTISNQYTINVALSKAKLVIHKDCSTALQAYLMGIPVISLNYGDSDKKVHAWSLNFGALPENMSETKTLIKDIIEHGTYGSTLDKKISILARKTIAEYFEKVPGASCRIVDYIKNDCMNHPYHFSMETKQRISFIQYLKMNIDNMLPSCFQFTSLTDFDVKLREIKNKLELFEKYDPIGCYIKARKIRKKLFYLGSNTNIKVI